MGETKPRKNGFNRRSFVRSLFLLRNLNQTWSRLMVSYPTMKSSFLGIRGQCWELTHDQNGDVYLEGLDDDHYEKTEVKRCDEDSILLPFVLDEMEAAWVHAFIDAVGYWQHYN